MMTWFQVNLSIISPSILKNLTLFSLALKVGELTFFFIVFDILPWAYWIMFGFWHCVLKLHFLDLVSEMHLPFENASCWRKILTFREVGDFNLDI